MIANVKEKVNINIFKKAAINDTICKFYLNEVLNFKR